MADFKLVFEGGVEEYTDIEQYDTAAEVRSHLVDSGEFGWMTLGEITFHRQRLICVKEHNYSPDKEIL